MQVATDFTERLCAAHDFNRGYPPADGAERVRRAEIIEYIDAYSVDRPPSHPTTAIHWDLVRTFGESEGRRLLLYASRRWDAKPLRARDIVFKCWWDDYEPQAWVDEYLVEIIDDWRWQRGRVQLLADAEREWLAFQGVATMDEHEAWHEKYGAWYLGAAEKLGRVIVTSKAEHYRAEYAQRLAEQAQLSAKQAKFAADMRAGRIPMPSAPQPPPPPPMPRIDFGGNAMPSRSKFRRK